MITNWPFRANGAINLVEAYRQLIAPTLPSARATHYLATVEAIYPITSRQAAAVAIAHAVTL